MVQEKTSQIKKKVQHTPENGDSAAPLPLQLCMHVCMHAHVCLYVFMCVQVPCTRVWKQGQC